MSELTTIRQLECLANIARKSPFKGQFVRQYWNGGKAKLVFNDDNMVKTLWNKRLVRIDYKAGTATVTEAGLKELDDICERIWPEAAQAMQPNPLKKPVEPFKHFPRAGVIYPKSIFD